MHQLLLKAASVPVLMLALAGIAKADVAAASTGSTLFLAAAGLVVVVVLWLLIRGALSLSGKEDKDEDGGFGVLEGIDDEDEDRKKKS
jgi:hypothetical protein